MASGTTTSRPPPNLVTITVDGRRIDAVAQVSKQGFTYVFDRVTGQPVWPIEERPVDTTTDVPARSPGRRSRFPTRPPAFTPQGVTLDDANDLTPEIKALALEQDEEVRLGPMFTPPSLRGTLVRPSTAGGANWGGAAFDPETGMLYVKTSNYVSSIKSARTTGAITHRSSALPTIYCTGTAGAPERPLGAIPLTKPPYAALVRDRSQQGRDCLAGALR